MYNGDWQEFWWNSITGPHRAVTGVAEALLSNAAVVLEVPEDMPWRHAMRRAVEEQIRSMAGAGSTSVKVIDAADECEASVNPGRYVLRKYATEDISLTYREGSGVSIQEYMIRHAVLRDTVVWIKGVDRTQAAQWLKFCRDYRSDSAADGRFVVELPESVKPSEARGLETVRYGELVREYDLQVFNRFVLDERNKKNDRWKNYIAALAASLCQTDAEVSEAFLRQTDFCTEEPLAGIEKVAGLPEFARRGEDDRSTHVLALWRRGELAELERRVWQAQLQTLFPIVEMLRVNLIQKYEDDLRQCLRERNVQQFGETVTDPYELEFGILTWLMAKTDDGGFRYLYLPDEDTRWRIHILKDCRNSLAHANCCTVDQVRDLLQLR